MSSLLILIPISVLVLMGAVWAFFWAVKNSQFDDLDCQARKIIFEDQATRKRDLNE